MLMRRLEGCLAGATSRWLKDNAGGTATATLPTGRVDEFFCSPPAATAYALAPPSLHPMGPYRTRHLCGMASALAFRGGSMSV